MERENIEKEIEQLKNQLQDIDKEFNQYIKDMHELTAFRDFIYHRYPQIWEDWINSDSV